MPAGHRQRQRQRQLGRGLYYRGNWGDQGAGSPVAGQNKKRLQHIYGICEINCLFVANKFEFKPHAGHSAATRRKALAEKF